MLTAGEGIVQLTRGTPQDWSISLNLTSAGFVSRLYKVLDNYKVSTNDRFCGENALLDAEEGKRHLIARLTFDNSHHKVDYEERDLMKNTSMKNQLDIAPCTCEITGALVTLRTTKLGPGQTMTIPITDGKKMAYAKIEGQAKESLTINGRNYSTVRYEAFVFDNVVYKRKGRLLVWVTDDARRLPVQFRLQMGFPIGTVTVLLDKEERL